MNMYIYFMTIYTIYTYVGVELADKAREVVVLEVVGKEISGELRRTPNDEGGVVFAPRDDVVGGGVVDELVGFGEEWCGD